jgi:hypothetical protein
MVALKPLSFQLEFGPIEIGGQLSSALWGVACVQTFMYAMRCRQDPPVLKLLVALLLYVNPFRASTSTPKNNHVVSWRLSLPYVTPSQVGAYLNFADTYLDILV